MLRLNHELLTSEGIIAYFEKNIVPKAHSVGASGPSLLSQFKTRLKATFFSEHVGCDLALKTVPAGTIDVLLFSKERPVLIKQEDHYFLYGPSDEHEWQLTRLNDQLVRDVRVDFSSDKILPYLPRCQRLYDHIALKNKHINMQKRPSDEMMSTLIETDNRFSHDYPKLKQVLMLIFALRDTDDKMLTCAQLKNLPQRFDWDTASIQEYFNYVNKPYGYFNQPSKEVRDLFAKLVVACRLMIVLFEKNNTPLDNMAYTYAYKLMVLFFPESSTFDALSKDIDHLMRRVDTDKKHPFHEALVVKLKNLPPAASLADLEGWKRLIKKEGPKVLPFFSNAINIEEKIAQQDENLVRRAPKDFKEASYMDMLCTYRQASKDLHFTALCKQYRVDEDTFNLCLDYMAESPGWPKKQGDSLPDVVIKGREDAQGYYWLKLPVTDKRALILGSPALSGCCQSIGGDSAQCVKDAVSLDDNGLYVLLKQRKPGSVAFIQQGEINDKDFKIVGQSYLWRTKTGNICLDSIEYLEGEISKDAIKSLMLDFAETLFQEDEKVHYVNVGQGGNTPHGVFDHAFITEEMRQGELYGDAMYQYCIAKSPHKKLTETQRKTLNDMLEPFSANASACMHYFIDMTDDYFNEPDQLIPRVARVLKEVPSLNQNALKRLWSLTEHPRLDMLMPIDFNAINRMSLKEKKAILKEVTAVQLLWRRTIAYDVLRVLPYLSVDEYLKLMSMRGLCGKTVWHFAAESGDVNFFNQMLDLLPKEKYLDVATLKDSSEIILLSCGNADIITAILSRLSADERFDLVMRTRFLHDVLDHSCRRLAAVLHFFSANQCADLMMIQDGFKRTVLHHAAAYPDALMTMLNALPKEKRFEALMIQDGAGKTVLHYGSGKIALHYATQHQDVLVKIMNDLLEKNRFAALMVKDMYQRTVLHDVATNHPNDVMTMLNGLKEENRFEALMVQSLTGKTVFHELAKHRDALVGILKDLPEEKRFAALMIQDVDQRTVLHDATEDVILALLNDLPEGKRFEVLTPKNKFGKTPLSDVVTRLRATSVFSNRSSDQYKSILSHLRSILNTLPKDKRFQAIVESGLNASELRPEIVSTLPEEERLNLLKAFGVLQLLFQESTASKNSGDMSALTEMVNCLPPTQQIEALEESGLFNHYDLKSMNWVGFVNHFPENQRYDLVVAKQRFNKTILHHVAENKEMLNAVLLTLPTQKARVNAVNQSGLLDRFTWNKALLLKVLSNLPVELRFDALVFQDEKGQSILDGVYELSLLLEVLEMLPKTLWYDVVMLQNNKYGNTLLHRMTQNPAIFMRVLNQLPEEKRLSAVMVRDHEDFTVLHDTRLDVECLTAVLALYPKDKQLEAVMAKDKTGKTVLHYHGQDLEKLKIILAIYPENEQLNAVMAKDKHGRTVLHMAVDDDACFRMMLDLYPKQQRLEAVETQDDQGQTMLHHAALTLETLKIILEIYPVAQQFDAVMLKDKHGQTVLDLAVKNLDCLQALLEICPKEKRVDIIMTQADGGQTLLHRARCCPASFIALWSMVSEEQHPDVLTTKIDALMGHQANKDTVLFLAVEDETSLKALLNMVPEERLFEAVTCPGGWNTHLTPLHHACKYPSSFCLILSRLPLEKRRDALMVKSTYETTVLEVAARNAECLSALLSLLPTETHMDLLQMKEASGRMSIFQRASQNGFFAATDTKVQKETQDSDSQDKKSHGMSS